MLSTPLTVAAAPARIEERLRAADAARLARLAGEASAEAPGRVTLPAWLADALLDGLRRRATGTPEPRPLCCS